MAPGVAAFRNERAVRRLSEIDAGSGRLVRPARADSQARLPSGGILVAHPTLQHSHQLALALHEKGCLRAFWSGVPVLAPDELAPPWMPLPLRQKIKQVAIPGALRLHPLRFQLALRVATPLLPLAELDFGDLAHRVFHWFDAWTAQRVVQLRPKVVVAYENSAYRTFAAAKSIGARCVLDAASLHHHASAMLVPYTPTKFDAEVNRRKDAEAEMADLILTCSPLAAGSYIECGVSRVKIRPLLLGADLPNSAVDLWNEGRVPSFIFAGVLSRRKSVDLIVEAFLRLKSEGFKFRLQFVGNVAEPALLKSIEQLPEASHHDGVAQSDLYALMGVADCLLLPSRFDSFGMVVAEAMACGTPALVSTQTGAKAIIQEFEGSGWVVKPDVEALTRQLRELLRNPALLHAARPRARAAAGSYTWAAYRQRAFETIAQGLS